MCDSGACAVKRVRRSIVDRRPSFLTPWNEFAPIGSKAGAQVASEEWPSFLDQLSTSVGTGWQSYATPLDNYLFGYDSPFDFHYAFHWHNISETAFSRRLTTVLNSFWTAAQFPYDVATDIFQKPTPYLANITAAGDTAALELSGYDVVTGVVTNHISVYHAHVLWVTLLIIISLMLLALSALSALIGVVTLAPDILGHVSSAVRGSPFDEDQPGTWMDGGQRARQFRDLKVQIVDPQPEAMVGSVALRAVPGDFAYVRALKRGRLYQ